jgi:hypothetical protein
VPFVILIVAIVMIVAALRGQQSNMFTLLRSEFSGTNSFIPCSLAIIVLAVVGNIKPIRPVADGFIVLVFVVMLVAPANTQGGGFFAQLNAALRAAPPPSPTPAPATSSLAAPSLAAPATPTTGSSGFGATPGWTPFGWTPGYAPAS